MRFSKVFNYGESLIGETGKVQRFEQLFNGGDRTDTESAALLNLPASVDQAAAVGQIVCQAGTMIQSLEEIPRNRSARLDLYRKHVAPAFENQIHLVTPAVPVKRHGVLSPPVEAVFQHFHQDEILEKAAPQGIAADMAFALHAQQIGGQADVIEIDLRRFDQSLGDVAVPWFQEKKDIARLEKGDPCSRRGMGDARVVGKAL